MAFPTQTQSLLVLGYSLVTIRSNPSLFPDSVATDIESMAYCQNILSTLALLDSELAENTRDSMAVKVQDLGLDYGQYIAQTLRRGSRLLLELSTAISTPVMFDKYMGNSVSISVKSYY